MKKTIFAFVILCLPLIAAITGGGWWLDRQLHSPAPFVVEQTFIVPKGATGMAIAKELRAAQIIKHDWLFYAAVRWPFYSTGPATIKAGEYLIPAKSSLLQVFELLRSGKTIVHSFTLPEGLTVKQAISLMGQQPLLTGTIPLLPPEGSLLPETYNFERDEVRLALIKRMQEAMTKVTDQLWDSRDTNLPFTTLKEAMTMASIVEKETALPAERARVAGVYINRLRIGMPLQADPTVVYAVTDGLGHMQGKRLWGKYLDLESPYNTYKNPGLPPGPIANPGKASIAATLHPENHDYLYFVADGKGGHIFAKTLAEHQRNAQRWHDLRRQQKRTTK
jgi:UPF0755 protein